MSGEWESGPGSGARGNPSLDPQGGVIGEIDLAQVDPEIMMSYLRGQGYLSPAPVPNSQPGTDSVAESEQQQAPPFAPVAPPDLSSMPAEELLRELFSRTGTHQPRSAYAGNAQAPPTAFPGKSLPKFPDPPVYEGDPTGLDGWVTQVETYLQANLIDLGSVRSVHVATMYLRKKAQDWWASRHHLISVGQAPPLGGWSDLVQALKDAFLPVELTRRYIRDLLTQAQGKADMRTYIASFNSARAKAPTVLSEEGLCFVFLQGCRADLQRAILVQGPKSLNEYFTLAVALSDLASSMTPPVKKASEKSPAGPAKEGRPKCSHCHRTGHTVEQCL